MQPEFAGSSTQNLEHQRLTSLVNSMADAVVAVDEDVNVVLYNAAALEIFDVNNIEIGSPIAKVCQPIDSDNQPRDIAAMVKAATTPTTSRDLRLSYSDDSIINLYLSIAPVHLGYGEQGQGGYVLLLRDITREKSLEEERDEFISVVSHELRTPITIAEGNISNAQFIAKKSQVDEVILKGLNQAHEQVLFLADMINDLSTLSRAERGTLQVDVAPIDVKAFTSDLVAGYHSEAAAKDLQLETDIDPALTKLSSSKLYVREILQNFITNAIKYSQAGTITVHAHPYDKGVKFAIQDTGIGISKSDQDRVFDKFFRSEDYRTREANGTGLGLYVTMKLTRLIHASVELESELNKGSIFTIAIPNLN